MLGGTSKAVIAVYVAPRRALPAQAGIHVSVANAFGVNVCVGTPSLR